MFPTTFPTPKQPDVPPSHLPQNSLELRGTGGTVRGGVDEVLFAASVYQAVKIMGAEIICWLEERPVYLQTVATPLKSHEHSTCNWCLHPITEPSYWLDPDPRDARDPYRCCTGAHRTCTTKQKSTSWWFILKASKVRKLWANRHPNCGEKKFGAILAQCSKIKLLEGQEQKQEKSMIPSMLPTNLSPWNLLGELPDCHPDTSKGGDLLRFDNSETLPSGKVTLLAGISPMFNRKYIFYPGPFFIAMLVYRSVHVWWFWGGLFHEKLSSGRTKWGS